MTNSEVEHTLDEHGRRIENHEGRLVVLEKTDAVHDARLDSLTSYVQTFTKAITRLFVLVLLTIIGLLFVAVLTITYGALGERGFNAVTNAAPKLAPSAAR